MTKYRVVNTYEGYFRVQQKVLFFWRTLGKEVWEVGQKHRFNDTLEAVDFLHKQVERDKIEEERKSFKPTVIYGPYP